MIDTTHDGPFSGLDDETIESMVEIIIRIWLENGRIGGDDSIDDEEFDDEYLLIFEYTDYF